MENVISKTLNKTFFFLSPSLYADLLFNEIDENSIETVTITGTITYDFPTEETYYELSNGMAYKVEDFHNELDKNYFGIATKSGYPKGRTIQFGFFTTKEKAQIALNKAIEYRKSKNIA